MFELFAALFGGGYLAARISKDKRNKIQAQSESAIRNAIIDMLTNYQLEEKLQRNLFYVDKVNDETSFNSFNESVKEIYAYRKYAIEECIPESDLRYVFGDDWKNILMPSASFLANGITSENAKEITNDLIEHTVLNQLGNKWGIIYNILLSTYGVVCSRHLVSGYQIGMEIKGVPFDDRYDVVKRACRVIERNIQAKHGKKDDFNLYATTIDLHSLHWGFLIEEILRVRLW